MALRKIAAETSMRLGLSAAASQQAPVSLMGAWSRAYAKGVVSPATQPLITYICSQFTHLALYIATSVQFTRWSELDVLESSREGSRHHAPVTQATI
jgi:hypothetical protein